MKTLLPIWRKILGYLSIGVGLSIPFVGITLSLGWQAAMIMWAGPIIVAVLVVWGLHNLLPYDY